MRDIISSKGKARRHHEIGFGINRTARQLLLFLASIVFLAYTLSPIVWLVSSSLQNEREIVSKPPHWLPHEVTFQNFAAIFAARDKIVTYETRRAGDPASGGFIPSTAKNLVPAMENSLIVAAAVVVLNLLIGIPAAYAMAKIRFRGRQASIYGILTTRVIPDIALVVPFFLFIRYLGLLDSLWSLIITYLAVTVPFSVFILISDFQVVARRARQGCPGRRMFAVAGVDQDLSAARATVNRCRYSLCFSIELERVSAGAYVYANSEIANAADHRGRVHVGLHHQLLLH